MRKEIIISGYHRGLNFWKDIEKKYDPQKSKRKIGKVHQKVERRQTTKKKEKGEKKKEKKERKKETTFSSSELSGRVKKRERELQHAIEKEENPKEKVKLGNGEVAHVIN